jgi:hypothetical protein
MVYVSKRGRRRRRAAGGGRQYDLPRGGKVILASHGLRERGAFGGEVGTPKRTKETWRCRVGGGRVRELNFQGKRMEHGGGQHAPCTRRRNASTHRALACPPPGPAIRTGACVWRGREGERGGVSVCCAGGRRSWFVVGGRATLFLFQSAIARAECDSEYTARTFCTRSERKLRSADEACDAMVTRYATHAHDVCVVCCGADKDGEKQNNLTSFQFRCFADFALFLPAPALLGARASLRALASILLAP